MVGRTRQLPAPIAPAGRWEASDRCDCTGASGLPGIDAPGTYPALEAQHDRMLARPAVQKALAIEKSYG
jgi:glutathione S-transferase